VLRTQTRAASQVALAEAALFEQFPESCWIFLALTIPHFLSSTFSLAHISARSGSSKANGQRSSARIAEGVNGTIEPAGPTLSGLNGAIDTLPSRRLAAARPPRTCGQGTPWTKPREPRPVW
jgi:hypothetical protein